MRATPPIVTPTAMPTLDLLLLPPPPVSDPGSPVVVVLGAEVLLCVVLDCADVLDLDVVLDCDVVASLVDPDVDPGVDVVPGFEVVGLEVVGVEVVGLEVVGLEVVGLEVVLGLEVPEELVPVPDVVPVVCADVVGFEVVPGLEVPDELVPVPEVDPVVPAADVVELVTVAMVAVAIVAAQVATHAGDGVGQNTWGGRHAITFNASVVFEYNVNPSVSETSMSKFMLLW